MNSVSLIDVGFSGYLLLSGWVLIIYDCQGIDPFEIYGDGVVCSILLLIL